MLNPALWTTLVAQAAVVIASLALPVLAPQVAAATGADPHHIGYFSGLVYGGAMLATLATPMPLRRFGAIRLAQATLALAAVGILLALIGTSAVFALSAIVIGLAYGPHNPLSSQLLKASTPPARRGQIFALKQTSVPLGGALAGLILPPIAVAFGWRAALLAVVLICIGTIFAVAPWRRRLDETRDRAAEWRRIELLRPLRFIAGHRYFRSMGIVAGVFAGTQFTFSAVFVTFLVDRAQMSNVAAGSLLSLALLSSVIARPVWGTLADRLSNPLMLSGLAAVMAAACLVTPFVGPETPMPLVGLLAIVFGISVFSWNGVYLAAVAARGEGEDVAAATSGTMAITFLGALLSPIAFSGLIGLTGGYTVGFVLLAILCLATIVLIQTSLK